MPISIMKQVKKKNILMKVIKHFHKLKSKFFSSKHSHMLNQAG